LPVSKIELLALRGHALVIVLDVLDDLLNVGFGRIDVCTLKHPRQKPGLPVLSVLDRIAARTHGDETG
jgi:hypothetical protein